MYNKLWKDLTDRLALEAFEGIYWGWGPKWVSFIKIDSPITVDKPLWTHEESTLETIRLFDLSPDELQREIVRYWQQPFWKRWLLSLFTSINHKIKLWSYYHRCLAVRKVSIINLYEIERPVESVFEQYLGEEILQRLFRTTMKVAKHLEKHAGDFKFEKNDRSVDSYLRENRKFFTKLINEKLALLDIENKDSLQKQLKKEFERHKMMLFSYLVDWEDQIFDEPIYFDEPIPLDICVNPYTEKKMTYSTQSTEEWIRVKQQILKLMLRDNSSEQFLKVNTFLESTHSLIKQLFNRQLERFEQLILKVKCNRLAAEKAIQQVNMLQKDLILFKKSVLLFHPDKSFGNKDLQTLQTKLFKDFSYLIKDSIERIKQGLQTLKECLITQKNKLSFYKMINKITFRLAELEIIREDLLARLDEMAGKVNNKEGQEIIEKLWQTETEIERVNSSYCNYTDFIKRPQAPLTRAPLKLMFTPLYNPRQNEPKEQEEGEVYETKYCPCQELKIEPFRRYRPVF